MQNATDWASAMDYLVSGLRVLPLDVCLLYNFAVCNDRLKNYDIAMTFFDFCNEIQPRYSNALFGKAVVYYRMGDYKNAKKYSKKALEHYKWRPEEIQHRDDTGIWKWNLHTDNEIVYFKAMCYRKIGKFLQA
jgi:tetratricopeptide (TPR) repeat protein